MSKIYVILKNGLVDVAYRTYEEAKKQVNLLNLSNSNYAEVKEIDLYDFSSTPKWFYVIAEYNIPFLTMIQKGTGKIIRSTSFSIEPVFYSRTERDVYEKDGSMKIVYSDSVTIRFFYKLEYVENELSADFNKRLTEKHTKLFEEFQKSSDYAKLKKIAYKYYELKEELDEIKNVYFYSLNE